MTTSVPESALEMATEMNPPVERKTKDKKWRPFPRPNALKKKGPSRPYKRLTPEILGTRIQKLSDRLEKSKKQVQFDFARGVNPDESHSHTTVFSLVLRVCAA